MNRKLLKTQSYHCIVKQSNDFFKDIQYDPLKKFIFSSTEVNKKINELHEYNETSKGRTQKLAAQYLNKNPVYRIRSFYKSSNILNLTDIKNSQSIVKNEMNLETKNGSYYDQFHVLTEVADVNILDKTPVYKVDQISQQFIKNGLTDDKDYVKLSHSFEQYFTNINNTSNLKENQLLVSNISKSSFKEIKCLFKDEDIIEIDFIKDIFGEPSLAILTFENSKILQKYLENSQDLKLKNKRVQFHQKNDQEESISNRRVVIAGLSEDTQLEEILLELNKYGSVEKYFYPKKILAGNIEGSFQTKNYFWEQDIDQKNENIKILEYGIDQPKMSLIFQGENVREYQNMDSITFDQMKNYEENFKNKIDQETKYFMNQLKDDFTTKVYPTIQNYDISSEVDGIENTVFQHQQISNKKLQHQKTNELGFKEVGLGFIIVDFSSKSDTQNAIYGLKFQSKKFDSKIELMNKRLLMEYLPDFQKSVFKQYLDQNQKYEKKKNEKEWKIERDLYNQLKDHMPDILKKRIFPDIHKEDQQNVDIKLLKHSEKNDLQFYEKQKKRRHLIDSLDKYIQDFVKEEEFSNGQIMEDRLTKMEEIEATFSIKGRQFSKENYEKEREILEQRIQQEKIKSKNFIFMIKHQFPEFTHEELVKEIQQLAYEKGVKEKIIKEFDVQVNKYFPYLIKQSNSMSQTIKRFYTQSQEMWNGKSYEQILEDVKSSFYQLFSGEKYGEEEFKKIYLESYQLKQQDFTNRLADLLFIRKVEGGAFFSEQDIIRIESDMNLQRDENQKAIENYEMEFMYKTYTPELILKNYMNKEEMLRDYLFEGILSGVYKYKEGSEYSPEQLVSILNQNLRNKSYQIRDTNQGKYIVEKTVLGNFYFLEILKEIQEYGNKVIEQLALKYEYNFNTAKMMIMYGDLKTKTQRQMINEFNYLMDYNAVVNHLTQQGFMADQIKTYFEKDQDQLQNFIQIYQKYKSKKEQERVIEQKAGEARDLEENIFEKYSYPVDNIQKELNIIQEKAKKEIFSIKQKIEREKSFKYQKKEAEVVTEKLDPEQLEVKREYDRKWVQISDDHDPVEDDVIVEDIHNFEQQSEENPENN